MGTATHQLPTTTIWNRCWDSMMLLLLINILYILPSNKWYIPVVLRGKQCLAIFVHIAYHKNYFPAEGLTEARHCCGSVESRSWPQWAQCSVQWAGDNVWTMVTGDISASASFAMADSRHYRHTFGQKLKSFCEAQARMGKGWPFRQKVSKLKALPRAYVKVGCHPPPTHHPPPTPP